MHVPLRRCRICRKQASKKELLRWVRTEGRLVRDERQIVQARGFYVCQGTCADKLQAKPERVKK